MDENNPDALPARRNVSGHWFHRHIMEWVNISKMDLSIVGILRFFWLVGQQPRPFCVSDYIYDHIVGLGHGFQGDLIPPKLIFLHFLQVTREICMSFKEGFKLFEVFSKVLNDFLSNLAVMIFGLKKLMGETSELAVSITTNVSGTESHGCKPLGKRSQLGMLHCLIRGEVCLWCLAQRPSFYVPELPCQ